MVQTQPCNTQACTDPAIWSQWSDFDKCSATCSGGRQARYRYCIGGEPGTEGCEGAAEEVFECNTDQCEGDELCPDSLFDIAFLVEANAQIGAYESDVKEFMKSIISKYKAVSPGDARLCLMRFTSWSELIQPFSALKDVNSALVAIDDMEFYGKGADLNQAVSSLHQMCFDESMGWRGTTINAKGVSSQAIIITNSNITQISQSAMIELKKKVQRILLVEIDGSVSNNDILVSSPSEDNLFHLSDFEELSEIVGAVVENQCKIDLWPDQCYFNGGKGYCDVIGFSHYY